MDPCQAAVSCTAQPGSSWNCSKAQGGHLRSPSGNATRSEAATLRRAAMPSHPSVCWDVRAAATRADAIRVAEFLASSFLAEVRGAGLTPAQWTELESEQLGRDPAQWRNIGAAQPCRSLDPHRQALHHFATAVGCHGTSCRVPCFTYGEPCGLDCERRAAHRAKCVLQLRCWSGVHRVRSPHATSSAAAGPPPGP